MIKEAFECNAPESNEEGFKILFVGVSVLAFDIGVLWSRFLFDETLVNGLLVKYLLSLYVQMPLCES